MKRSKKKAIIISIIMAVFVFLAGFGVLYTFWKYGSYDPSLPGLFTFRAASYGDAICLPLLVGALTFTKLIHARPPMSWLKKEWVVTVVAGLVGVFIQASWLISDRTALNWTIPRLHHFNAPGWWHAVFFVFMFALLGNLFSRYVYIKTLTDEYEDSAYSIFVQAIIWFAVSWFLFLHNTDDYLNDTNKFFVLTLTLFICLTFAFALGVGIDLVYNKVIVFKDIIPVLSGVMTAYALTNVMFGSVQTDVFYLISCALLIIILVVPDTEKYSNMFFMYFIIAIPTLLLEMAISVQNTIPRMLFVFILALMTPCIIALCQKDQTGFNILRKGIYASIIILVYISVLVIVFVIRDNSDYSELFEMLLGFVLVYAVPMYVKSTFKQIIEAEDSNELDRVKRLQFIMYVLYICIYLGTVILIFRALFPNIHWYRSGQYVMGRESIYGLILLFISCLVLFVIFAVKDEVAGWRQKLIACIFLGIGYLSLIMILIPSILNHDELHYKTGNWIIIFFSVFVWIGYPLTISLGFRSNIASIRGIAPDGWVNAVAIILFAGTMAVSMVAEYQMFLFNTVSAILVNGIYLLIAGIGLPFLIAGVLERPLPADQVAKNTPKAGVAQDGALFGMLAFLSELLTIFFIGKLQGKPLNFAEVTGLIISGVVYISIMSWPLEYCIKNNIDHYRKRKQEIYHSTINNVDDALKLKEKIVHALLKHLRMQNITTLFISLPYSLYPLNALLFEYGMGDENDLKKLVAKVLPGIDE